MKKFARFLFHLSRNMIFPNYRYLRLSFNETGSILFYDRDRRDLFRVYSRGLIDSVTANQIYSNNEYNFSFIGRREQLRAIYDGIVEAGKVPLIIDCGANIGLSPQYFAREFPQAKIVAVEPDAENFALATRNCSAFPNIEMLKAAIGSEAGLVAIENQSGDANAFRVSRVDTEEGIELKTIPDLIGLYPEAEVFIVKVDIEGFEQDLFARNVGWIEQCSVLIVELHDWMLPNQASSANFIRAIASYDRDFLFKGESVFSISNRH